MKHLVIEIVIIHMNIQKLKNNLQKKKMELNYIYVSIVKINIMKIYQF